MKIETDPNCHVCYMYVICMLWIIPAMLKDPPVEENGTSVSVIHRIQKNQVWLLDFTGIGQMHKDVVQHLLYIVYEANLKITYLFEWFVD